MKQGFHLPASAKRVEILDRLMRFLNRLPADKAWKVEVFEHRPTRSIPQNRYLWGVVYPAILQSGHLQGWTAEDLHEYLLGEHFGWKVMEGFGKKRLRPLRRSAKLNKQEFSDYIAFIQQKMAEHGIYVPDANED